MRAISTRDVSLEDLRDLSTKLGPDFALEIDESQRFYKSASPPSWVTLFAQANWWIKVLGVYVGVYIAGIVNEAGKDTWKNRGKILSATVDAGNRVRQFAIALCSLRSQLTPKTRIEIGLPFPDDDEGTRFELVGSDVDELSVQIALFAHYLPQLVDLIHKEKLSRANIVAGIQVLIHPDLSLEVSWHDASLKRQARLLHLSLGTTNT